MEMNCIILGEVRILFAIKYSYPKNEKIKKQMSS